MGSRGHWKQDQTVHFLHLLILLSAFVLSDPSCPSKDFLMMGFKWLSSKDVVSLEQEVERAREQEK